jgi:poly(A) polymerase
VQRVERLLAHHPVERRIAPERAPAVRRLLARLGPQDVDRLLQLREGELAVLGDDGEAGGAALARLRETLAQVRRQGRLALHRQDLALDGRDVIALLGVRGGPVVGRALAHLTECVLEDPSCNVREKLTERLRAWWAAQSP